MKGSDGRKQPRPNDAQRKSDKDQDIARKTSGRTGCTACSARSASGTLSGGPPRVPSGIVTVGSDGGPLRGGGGPSRVTSRSECSTVIHRPQPYPGLFSMPIPEIPPPTPWLPAMPPSPPPTGSDKLDDPRFQKLPSPDSDEETVALTKRLHIFDLRTSDIEKVTVRIGSHKRRKGVFEAFGLTQEAVSAATSSATSARSSRQSSVNLVSVSEPPSETTETAKRDHATAKPRRDSRVRKVAVRKWRRSREMMKALQPTKARRSSPALAAALADVEKSNARSGMDGALDMGSNADQLEVKFEASESAESALV